MITYAQGRVFLLNLSDNVSLWRVVADCVGGEQNGGNRVWRLLDGGEGGSTADFGRFGPEQLRQMTDRVVPTPTLLPVLGVKVEQFCVPPINRLATWVAILGQVPGDVFAHVLRPKWRRTVRVWPMLGPLARFVRSVGSALFQLYRPRLARHLKLHVPLFRLENKLIIKKY